MKRALELDPLSLDATVGFGTIYLDAGQYEQGTKEYRKALEMDPNYPLARFYLACAYLFQGMYDEALSELRKYSELIGGHPDTDGSLALYYAFVGNREDALKSLALLQRKGVSPRFVAVIYARLGDKDQAFNWLEKAYEEHHALLKFLNVTPWWQPLHSDPRFQDLARRVGIPQCASASRNDLAKPGRAKLPRTGAESRLLDGNEAGDRTHGFHVPSVCRAGVVWNGTQPE